MKNNYFRYYKPGYIIGLILMLGSVLGALMTWLISVINSSFDLNYYQYPGTSALVVLIIILIDKKLWKYKGFRFLFSIPDLSGRYEGEIEYKHPVSKNIETKKCAIEVFQTGSIVKFNSYFKKENDSEKTPSRSLVETVVKNDNNTYTLVFTYQNEGIPEKFPLHNGTNILNYINNSDGKFLKGIYYTNREPHQTRGTMDVKFSTKHLKNDY